MTSPLAINYNTPTGIVVVVFAISQSIATVLERADDNGSGSAGTFAVVSTIPSTDLAGSPFLDLLPDDKQERYYRAKHIHAGYLDSGYTETVNARPVIIPAGLDLSSRPWLYNSSIPLQLVMDVVADTTSSLIVTASVNLDPANLGTPTVSVLSYSSNLSVPINTSYLTWLIQKPASGQGRVTFTSTLSGRQSGLDSIDIQAAPVTSTGSFLTLTMNQTSANATTVTVSSSVINPNGYPYGVSLYSALGVSPTSSGAGTWNIPRPTSGIGTAIFHVTSSIDGIVDDFADVEVDYLNLTPLAVQARALYIAPSSMSVAFDVTDPYTPTGSLSGIGFSFTTSSLNNFSASLGALTNTAGVYSQVVNVSSLPAYGTGEGQIVGTATKTGYTPGQDSIQVPQNVTGLAHLVTGAIVTAESATTVVVSGSCYDPLGSGSALPTISMSMFPNVGFTGTNPWTINRPLSSSVQVTVFGTKIGRVPDTATATVASNPASITESDFLELYISQANDSVDSMVISSSVGNAGSHPLTYTILSSDNDAGISDTGNGGYVITRPTSGTATYHFQVSTTDPGIVSGTKTFYVDSANDTDLNCDWAIASTTGTTMTVNITVTDPFNTTATLSGITMTQTDSGNAGLVVTHNSTTTNTGNTVYNYTISKPSPGAGLAGVTWTATKSGYGAGVASLTVDEATALFLSCTAFPISSSTINVSVAVTGSSWLNDGTAPTIALNNPSGITTSRTSTANSASTVNEEWLLTYPQANQSAAGILFIASKTGWQNGTAPFLVSPQMPTGSLSSGSGGSTPSIPTFTVDSPDWTTSTVGISWSGANEPSGVTYTVVVSADASWSPTPVTFNTITSPYSVDLSSLATLGKAAGWESIDFDLDLQMKNSGGTVVVDRDKGTAAPGTNPGA